MDTPHHFVDQNIDGFPTSILYGLTTLFDKNGYYRILQSYILWVVLLHVISQMIVGVLHT